MADADVQVTVMDRRPAPGGHWLNAYPFVRLHTPSAFSGINSLALGHDRVDPDGENAGFYERAGGGDVREYCGTMLSTRALEGLRQISNVVRLGRVRRIEADRIVAEGGRTGTGPDVLHGDCTALGLNNAPATPIFQPGRIVLQQVRYLSPCFNAALIGFVEANRDNDADKNRLCPTNPYPSSVEDWPGMMSRTWRTEGRWLSEPDIAAWVGASRLNLLRALPDHATEPSAQAAVNRFLTHARPTHVRPAIERLGSWTDRSLSA